MKVTYNKIIYVCCKLNIVLTMPLAGTTTLENMIKSDVCS